MNAVLMALLSGFRIFDTAEAPYWYDQVAVGKALENFFSGLSQYDNIHSACAGEGLAVSTKIPPWELTSIDNVRNRARMSQEEILGFCSEGNGNIYPLDVYYIHAPKCWKGWHPSCVTGHETTLSLRESWLAMEHVLLDGAAERIGLSNVSEDELLDIINFVQNRQNNGEVIAHMPDVVQAYADPLRPATELRKICSEHDIEFVSYSTLGTQHTMRTRGGGNPVLGNQVVRDLATFYGRSTAEVVLSWALQSDPPMSIIPRSSNEKHIQQLSTLIDSQPFLDISHLALIDNLAWS